jgi:ketosteroid isomerase-like protein
MKTRIIAMTALALVLALPVALHAQETDPMSIVNAWLDALNAGDINAALSYLADDAVVTIVPPPHGMSGVFTGKEEIRGWYEGVVAGNGSTTLSDCEVDGETVTCINTYTDDGLQAMGIDFIEGEWVAIVRDGKIQSYTFTTLPESLAKFPPPPEALPGTGGTTSIGTLPLWLGVGGLLLLALGVGLRRASGHVR